LDVVIKTSKTQISGYSCQFLHIKTQTWIILSSVLTSQTVYQRSASLTLEPTCFKTRKY